MFLDNTIAAFNDSNKFPLFCAAMPRRDERRGTVDDGYSVVIIGCNRKNITLTCRRVYGIIAYNIIVRGEFNKNVKLPIKKITRYRESGKWDIEVI